jgi:hypothetical protein
MNARKPGHGVPVERPAAAHKSCRFAANAIVGGVGIPRDMHWLFWDAEASELEPSRDATYVIPRVLERGRLSDVRWLIATFGLDAIHEQLRDHGHVELSARTLALWRLVLDAKDETWAEPPDFRKHSAALWPS